MIVSLVWLLDLTVSPVHAQDPVPEAHTDEPSSVAPDSPPSAAAPPTFWQPKHFPPLYEREPSDAPPRHSGMMITGISLFIGSYIASAAYDLLLGAYLIDDCHDDIVKRSCDDSTLLLIPFVGPFMATDQVPMGLKLWFTGTQVVSLVFTLIGISRYTNDEPTDSHTTRRERAQLPVYAVPLPGGALLATSVRF